MNLYTFILGMLVMASLVVGLFFLRFWRQTRDRLFAMFSASPRVMIEALHFAPMQLGLFFAGTVMVVFTAGMLATKLAPRLGLDRSIQIGLALATLAWPG